MNKVYLIRVEDIVGGAARNVKVEVAEDRVAAELYADSRATAIARQYSQHTLIEHKVRRLRDTWLIERFVRGSDIVVASVNVALTPVLQV